MQMLVSEKTGNIEQAESLVFGRTLEMLQKYEALLGQMKLHVLISVEGWCLREGKIHKIRQALISNYDRYEAVIALYPVRDQLVLRNRLTGEISCAAVVCCKEEWAGSTHKMFEDQQAVCKLQGQLQEVLEGIKEDRDGYVRDATETEKIRLETKKIHLF